MYLIALVIILMIDNINLRKKAKDNYTISTIILLIIMTIMTQEVVMICTGILTILIFVGVITIQKLKNIFNKSKKENIDITQKINLGFYLAISNVISLISVIFINNWIL